MSEVECDADAADCEILAGLRRRGGVERIAGVGRNDIELVDEREDAEPLRHRVVEPQHEIERHQSIGVAPAMWIRAVLRGEMARIAKFAEDGGGKGEVLKELPRPRESDIPVAPILAVVGAAEQIVRRHIRVLQRLRDVPLGNRMRVGMVAGQRHPLLGDGSIEDPVLGQLESVAVVDAVINLVVGVAARGGLSALREGADAPDVAADSSDGIEVEREVGELRGKRLPVHDRAARPVGALDVGIRAHMRPPHHFRNKVRLSARRKCRGNRRGGENVVQLLFHFFQYIITMKPLWNCVWGVIRSLTASAVPLQPKAKEPVPMFWK